ncbi:t-SNARE coiled-coil-like proteiny domain-containing protein [Entamoeba marina]
MTYSGDVLDSIAQLKSEIETIRIDLGHLKTLSGDQHVNKYNSAKNHLGIARNVVKTLKIEARTLEKVDHDLATKLNGEIKGFNSELDKFANSLSYELTNNKKDINVEDLNADESLAIAQRLQEEDKGHLNNAIQNIEESKQVGGAISLQLDQQNEQLDNAIDMVDEIGSTLDIANKELTSISRRLATDKIIMVLIILCVIVIIGCSALYILFG